MKKKIVLVLSLLSLFLFSMNIYASDSLKIELQIDNKKVTINNSQIINLEQAPFIKDSITLVPIRFVSETLNADVKWDGDKRQVLIKKENKNIVLTIDDKKVLVNNKVAYLESPSILKNGTTFVPLRFVSENLDAKVTWIQSTKSIIIESQNDDSNSVPQLSEEDKVKNTMTISTESFNNKNSSAYLNTFYKSTDTIDSMNAYFKSHDVIYTIVKIENININNDKATLNLTRKTESYETSSNGEKYVSITSTAYFTVELIKINNEWKIVKFKFEKVV